MFIHLICAARPNFMKIAPLYHALKGRDWAQVSIVHTGQHYDVNMSDVFFRDLRLPNPDIHLGVGSGTHAEQTGKVMMAYEKVIFEQRPDVVIVAGDVNSTLACSLAAVKVNLADGTRNLKKPRPVVVHLEAGLRSFDRSMPEEINRIVTDALSDLLLTPSKDADEHLIREGIAREKIVRVGNIMIDSLEMLRKRIESLDTYRSFGLSPMKYGLVTLHRPANVDNSQNLLKICEALVEIGKVLHLVLPLHPRTRKNLSAWGLLKRLEEADGLKVLEPLPYAEFMNLVFNSALVITDSGGIQEETTYLGIPCLTLRPNTERPITLELGTNQLCKIEQLVDKVKEAISQPLRKKCEIEFWDGKTALRIVECLKTRFVDSEDGHTG